jgi:hypothetical protein
MLFSPDNERSFAPSLFPPFIIFALPRSRTAWLAHWLHAPEHPVGHDIAIECNQTNDFVQSFIFGMRGAVETGAIEGWRQITKVMPHARFLTIRRPLEEVKQSLTKFGLIADDELAQREVLLDEIEFTGRAERIDFVDLQQRGCRRWIWNYLLPEFAFDSERDMLFEQTNIQVDMQARIVQLGQRAGAINLLKKELLRATG